MTFAVTPDAVRSAFGLSGVVYFPRYDAVRQHVGDRTAHFLSSVGLPDTEWFMSKAGLRATDSVNLAEWYSEEVVDGIWWRSHDWKGWR